MISVEDFYSQRNNKEIVSRVQNHELPDELNTVLEEYERVIGERDTYLWKWLHVLFPKFTLTCVPTRDIQQIGKAKLLASVFIVLLDDLAEKRLDRLTFEETSKIPFKHQTPIADRQGVDKKCLAFAKALWKRFKEIVDEAPRSTEFSDIFYFDLQQTINAIEYSYIANWNLEMCNSDENETYDSPNMMLFTYVNIDLMYSPVFDLDDLAPLRNTVFKAQTMVRIGNWLSTWEREVREGDFNSGVVVYALENDIVSRQDLYELRRDPAKEDIEQIVRAVKRSKFKEHFFARWQEKYAEIEGLESEMASVDLCQFLNGIRKVTRYQMASRGLK